MALEATNQSKRSIMLQSAIAMNEKNTDPDSLVPFLAVWNIGQMYLFEGDKVGNSMPGFAGTFSPCSKPEYIPQLEALALWGTVIVALL